MVFINMFLLLYGRFCSVDSLVLLVYLHFTPEIDIPFVQLNQKCLCEGTQTLVMIAWKSQICQASRFNPQITDKTSVLGQYGTKARSGTGGALGRDLCCRLQPRIQPRQALCRLPQCFGHSLQWAQQCLLLAVFVKAPEIIVIFQLIFLQPGFPWWYKQEETALGILRTSSWKVGSGSTDK